MAKVLVVPTSVLEVIWQGPLFQGAVAANRLSLSEVLSHATIMDRDRAEGDPAFKQLIPYVAFEMAGQWLVYARADRSGEKRLVGNVSIGFGGHIEEEDMEDGWASSGARRQLSYSRALEREVEEELLYAPDLKAPKFVHVGWINDDSTPVGRVHLGVAHVQRVSRREVQSFDPAIEVLGFADPQVVARMDGHLEPWSRYFLGAGFRSA